MTPAALLSRTAEVLALPVVKAVLVLILGLLLVRLVAAFVQRQLSSGTGAHWALVARKGINYVGVVVVLMTAGQVAGIDLTAVIATAGLATVAIGFAAQTSLSNLIAGLFLLIDRPFKVGDIIELEGRSGVVMEISLLSTFVRTFDNILVRWPNEVVLKATILNLSRFPARRVDLRVGVAYGSDLAKARAVLTEAVRSLDCVLLEPAAEAVTVALQDSSVALEVRAWVNQGTFLGSRTQLVECIHSSLGDAGIEIAFPQITVWRGGVGTAPIDGGEPQP